ncbi:MAG: NAD(P)/FAD-dependent oxidoreductase [Proteobacteria bacterium]|nr:NAD(P)/FAD-dependent oxidoreductase [Pseudomonadota bacterium]
MAERYDVVVVGSGPNGLAAAVTLAQAGLSVHVIEGAATVGGGMRTAELTLPGFAHDLCAAVHPMAALSPLFRRLELEKHDLRWLYPEYSVAHPLPDQPAVLLARDLDHTAAGLSRDARAWRRLFSPLVDRVHALMADTLGPIGIPKAPRPFLWFGLHGLWPASWFARAYFREERARALFAGCAAHAIAPFEKFFTSAMGLVFALSGHAVDWPVAKGGSQSIAQALVRCLQSAGGSIQTSTPVRELRELPGARAYVLDLAPKHVARIAHDQLPAGYRKRLLRYRYGPGVFKLDWALNARIPWRDAECARASTVHVGGQLAEIARAERQIWYGQVPERPFVLVAQQSHFDTTRAPAGKHTGYAYAHVPHACSVDMTDAIETQIERYAPGFRDTIEARTVHAPAALERHNPNLVGGVVTGGANDLRQLFTRPVVRLRPYTTPNPRIFLCSASTPPGGGVHGMNGYHAARAVLRHLRARRA